MDTNGFQTLDVSVVQDGKVVVLRFDHGKANEMGVAQLHEIERLLERIEADTDVVAMITWSDRTSRKGTPIFVAGANVTERAGWDDSRVKNHVAWQREVLTRLRKAPVFHVGVVAGVALGWGTEYLLCCDYRIAAPGAVFALPETGLGIVPGAGGTSELWSHVGVAHALRLGMTCERVGPQEAERIGLVQEVAKTPEAAFARAQKLAGLVARRSPTAVAAYKYGVLACVGLDPKDRPDIEAQAYEHAVNTGQAAIGREHFSDIREGRVPPWGPRVPWGGEDGQA